MYIFDFIFGDFPFRFVLLFIALFFDVIFADNFFLWRYLGHPVAWVGFVIDCFERLAKARKKSKLSLYIYGYILVLFLFFLCFFIGVSFEFLLKWSNFSFLYIAIFHVFCVWIFLSSGSLYLHVASIRDALLSDDIILARSCTSLIVGRDTSFMSKSDICRATIESLAENSSDGAIAPFLYYLFFGLPGLFFYKALNTSDSMIGHKKDHYNYFGFASARLDDFLNYIPSRFTSLLLLIVCLFYRPFSLLATFRCIFRDSSLHVSVNAGYPEAAFAGLLNIRLGGRRYYKGYKVEGAYLNYKGRDILNVSDINKALRVYIFLHVVFLILLTMIIYLVDNSLF